MIVKLDIIKDESETIELIDKLVEQINKSNGHLQQAVDRHHLIRALIDTRGDLHAIIGSKVLAANTTDANQVLAKTNTQENGDVE